MAAAAAPHEPPPFDLSTSPALTVLLQHPCVATDSRVLLPLMASSTSINAAALSVCHGRLELVLANPPSEEKDLLAQSALACWLGRYGSLLAAIDCTRMQLALLQALAAHCSGSLQRLALHEIRDPRLRPGSLQAGDAMLAQKVAMAQLTALTSLEARSDVPILFGTFRLLPQLRRLSVHLWQPQLLAMSVPPHLEQLHNSSAAEWTAQHRAAAAVTAAGACPSMQLQHATALTSLGCSGLELLTDDRLPPKLLELSALDAPTQLLVQQARGVRRLDLSGTRAAASDLAHLAAQLTALSAVALSYRAGDTRAAEAAAAGWSSLPVRALRLPLHSPLASAEATLQHMGRLTGLTALHISGGGGGVLGPADSVAAALQQMPGLQQLRLVGEIITPAAGEGGAAAASSGGDGSGGFARLLATLGQLRQLRSLELSKLLAAAPQPEAAPAAGAAPGAVHDSASEWLRSPAAAAALAAAPQALTRLCLWRCDWLSDGGLIEVAQRLQGLLELRVEYMQQITDSVLPAIASCQLSRLSLAGTSVSDGGLCRLTGLQHLCVSKHVDRCV